MQSLKKLVEESKPILDLVGRQVSRRSLKATQKNVNGNASKTMTTLNTRRVLDFTPTNIGHKNPQKQILRTSRRGQMHIPTNQINLTTSKKISCGTTSPMSLAAKKRTVSTRLQLKTKVEKHKKNSNLEVSKVRIFKLRLNLQIL